MSRVNFQQNNCKVSFKAHECSHSSFKCLSWESPSSTSESAMLWEVWTVFSLMYSLHKKILS
jgi:hypothetical protein